LVGDWLVYVDAGKKRAPSKVVNGGSRGGAWGPAPPPYSGPKTSQKKKPGGQAKKCPPFPSPIAQGLDPPLEVV